MKSSLFLSILIPLGLLLSNAFSSCETTPKDPASDFEKFIQQAHERGQFNGNILVLKAGEVIYQKAIGLQNIDPLDSLNLKSIFRLGSVSKQFTAMGIMILKEQGKLDYDQDIKTIIPELPYEGITIRHLLHHVSGLPDYYFHMVQDWKPELDIEDPGRSLSGNEDVIAFLAAKQFPLVFETGSKWEYSNTGYVLLASIVARVSEMPFEDFLKEQIFLPAEMHATSVYKYVYGNDPQMPHRTYGFRTALDGNTLLPHDAHFLNAVQGDGGIYSTLEDLLKWDRILYTEKLVSKVTLEEAFTSRILENGTDTQYGFGWFCYQSELGRKVVFHSGGWVGFVTNIHREIEEDHCIIILTNNTTPYIGGIIEGANHLLHGKEAALPKRSLYQEMGKVVINEGGEKAKEHYEQLKLMAAHEYDFNEHQLNNLGYQLLNEGYLEEALTIFKINVEAYPEVANTYDSYGDGLLAAGDTLKALNYYRKAVELDSSFQIAKEKIERWNHLEKK
jgi:CubicO group peptidase (beta-lactamase class C family)